MNIFKSITRFLKKKSQATYDGAGRGNRLANWYPSNASINSLLASNLSTLRTRSHDVIQTPAEGIILNEISEQLLYKIR